MAKPKINVAQRIDELNKAEKQMFDTYKNTWGDDEKKADHLERMAAIIRERISLVNLTKKVHR